MEFRVLGPFEVLHEGAVVPVSAAKHRALLAVLLLRVGHHGLGSPADRGPVGAAAGQRP